MSTAMNDQETRLGEEILAGARQKAAQVLEHARREAAKIAAAAEQAAAGLRADALRAADREGSGKARAILAGIRHELHRRWLLRREAVLGDVLAEVLRRVEADGPERARRLVELAAEGVRGVGLGNALRFAAGPADAALLTPARLAAVAVAAGGAAELAATWRVDAVADMPPGLLVETADGRRRSDQIWRSRLRRREDDLRQAAAAFLGADRVDVEKAAE